MRPVDFILPTELYNLINRKSHYPAISDPNYLLLLDSRSEADYNESHILMAKHCKMDEHMEYIVPEEAELECKQHIVIYDNNTSSLKDNGDAIACSQKIWLMGSRFTVFILKGGYEHFSALYPFMRTQKIMWTPKELDDFKTYPIEIIPNLLYIGDWRQANAAYIQKDLKITGHVNCTQTPGTFFCDFGKNLVQVYIDDENTSDIRPYFDDVINFIQSHKHLGGRVLVFSDKGMSRSSAFCLAYIMKERMIPLREARSDLRACSPWTEPLKVYVDALIEFEDKIFKAYEEQLEKNKQDEDAVLPPPIPRTSLCQLGY